MDGLHSLFGTYGLTALFATMFLKSVGVPIPVPSDVILLAVAAGAANHDLVLWQACAVMLGALAGGGLLQYLLVRGPARALLYRVGRYIGLTPSRLDGAAKVVRQRGPLALSIAMVVPGVRAGAVAACGLAAVPFRIFFPALLLSSGAFLAIHFVIGYLGAASLLHFTSSVPLFPTLLALLAFLGIGVVVWLVIRWRQHPHAAPGEIAADALGAWEETACPLCLVLGSGQKVLGGGLSGAATERGGSQGA